MRVQGLGCTLVSRRSTKGFSSSSSKPISVAPLPMLDQVSPPSHCFAVLSSFEPSVLLPEALASCAAQTLIASPSSTRESQEAPSRNRAARICASHSPQHHQGALCPHQTIIARPSWSNARLQQHLPRHAATICGEQELLGRGYVWAVDHAS